MVIQSFQNKYLMADVNDHNKGLQTVLLSYMSTPHAHAELEDHQKNVSYSEN